MILQKAIEFNKNGTKNDKNIFIKSSSDTMKNSLITIVGGSVHF